MHQARPVTRAVGVLLMLTAFVAFSDLTRAKGGGGAGEPNLKCFAGSICLAYILGTSQFEIVSFCICKIRIRVLFKN